MFNFKNMCSWRKIKDMELSLPVTPAGAPDWFYMEEYMRGIQRRADAALDALSAVCGADDIGGGYRDKRVEKVQSRGSV